MGWHQIREFDSESSADDNPFAGSRAQPTGKVSVKLPVETTGCVDRWRRMEMPQADVSLIKNLTLNSVTQTRRGERKTSVCYFNAQSVRNKLLHINIGMY